MLFFYYIIIYIIYNIINHQSIFFYFNNLLLLLSRVVYYYYTSYMLIIKIIGRWSTWNIIIKYIYISYWCLFVHVCIIDVVYGLLVHVATRLNTIHRYSTGYNTRCHLLQHQVGWTEVGLAFSMKHTTGLRILYYC